MVKKNLEQWFLHITDYAQELLDSLDDLPGWPEKVKIMQRNWIGRSEGVRLSFALYGTDIRIETFTTRIDTIFGVTFLALSPEHPMVEYIAERSPARAEIELRRLLHGPDRAGAGGGGREEGIDTGLLAVNP